MRTHFVINDALMREVLKVTGLKTKREAVELVLRTLLKLRQQEDFMLVPQVQMQKFVVQPLLLIMQPLG